MGLSSRTSSTTQRRARLARPGTLTRTEQLGFPSRPLRWLSPLTPTTFPSSPQPSSASRGLSKSRRLGKRTATPSAPTVTDSDTPMPDAPRSTPPAPFVRFIILAQPRDVRTPRGRKGGDSKAISGCCPTSPPHCPNCGDDHDAFCRTCRARPVPPPQPEAPAPSDEELSDASSESEEAMAVGDDRRPAPSTPAASPAQTIDLSTPRPAEQSRDTGAPPSRSRPAPTGQGLPPATPYKSSGPSRK